MVSQQSSCNAFKRKRRAGLHIIRLDMAARVECVCSQCGVVFVGVQAHGALQRHEGNAHGMSVRRVVEAPCTRPLGTIRLADAGPFVVDSDSGEEDSGRCKIGDTAPVSMRPVPNIQWRLYAIDDAQPGPSVQDEQRGGRCGPVGQGQPAPPSTRSSSRAGTPLLDEQPNVEEAEDQPFLRSADDRVDRATSPILPPGLLVDNPPLIAGPLPPVAELTSFFSWAAQLPVPYDLDTFVTEAGLWSPRCPLATVLDAYCHFRLGVERPCAVLAPLAPSPTIVPVPDVVVVPDLAAIGAADVFEVTSSSPSPTTSEESSADYQPSSPPSSDTGSTISSAGEGTLLLSSENEDD